MKTILCYGDSNTWGYEPGSARRYHYHHRWPGVLAGILGPGFHVIEEALCSRTTVLDDPTRPWRNGLSYLRPCLDSHAPLDLILLMLGTNDLKHRFGLSAFDIGINLTMLLTTIQLSGTGRDGQAPPVFVLAPPPLGPLSELAEMFAGGPEKSRHLVNEYRVVASRLGCRFLDTGQVVRVSPVDGVHLDDEQHRRLGEHLATLLNAKL